MSIIPRSAFARMMLLFTVILMDILAGAEIDLFIPSFPELQHQFKLTPVWVEGLLSSNFVGFCFSLIFVGRLADRHGRKPVILVGLIIFSFGSILCLSAPSFPFLLAGRFFQGVGVAAPATLYFLIIADTYPLKQQQYLMAMLNSVINISIGLAPVIGSYVTLYFHWQGNFVMLLILGLITLGMTLYFIPTQHTILSQSTSSSNVYRLIITAKSFMPLLFSMVFIFVPYWIFIGIAPVLYMKDLGVSLTQFGYYQGAMALVFALGSLLSGAVLDKFDGLKMLNFSLYICVFGFVAIGWATYVNCSDPLLITLVFLPYSIGTIVPTTILYTACLNFIPEAKGRISAVIQGTRLILTALGLELAGYFYQGSFQNIGLVILFFFLITIIGLICVMKNSKLMNLLKQSSK